jgi:hypothetical protein
MDVIGHNDCGMEIDSLSVVMDTMREKEIARRVGERFPDQFAERDKQRPSEVLEMRQPAPVIIFASRGFSHASLQCRNQPVVCDE